MRLCVLHNLDHDLLDEDPGREAREDVVRVATAVSAALEDCGAEVSLLPVGRDPLEAFRALRQDPPDLVFNLCESLGADSRGEMAVPCLLDLLGIPYTGSSALALGLALHKHQAKQLLAARGISTPEFRLVGRVEDCVRVDLPFPLIVKPCREDASVGVTLDSVVADRRSLGRAVSAVLRTFRQPALVERYVEGREIYVPLLGNRPSSALPLSEIRFGPSFDSRPKVVSYRAKWEPESAECLDSPAVPCSLDDETEARLVGTAQAAFEAIGCRDYGRVDIRLAEDGTAHVIEINPNCDLHPSAGFARAASAAGLEYPALALRLVEIALERGHGDKTHRTAGPRAVGRPARPNRNVLAGRGQLRARVDRRRAQAE